MELKNPLPLRSAARLKTVNMNKTDKNKIKQKIILRRNVFGALRHDGFLAPGMALTQPTTVIAVFVAELTGSTVWVGGLTTVLTVAGALPQIFVARWIEPRPRKMPFLLAAIYRRRGFAGATASPQILSRGQITPNAEGENDFTVDDRALIPYIIYAYLALHMSSS